MDLSDLSGEARKAYDTWRDLGLSEAEALEEASAIQTEQAFDEHIAQIIAARSNLPIEEARQQAAAGRRTPSRIADPFDALVESFKARGMSAAAAKLAVIGRNGGSEAEVRESMRASLRETTRPPVKVAQPEALQEAVRAAARFHGMTETNARALIEKRLEEAKPTDPTQYLTEYARQFGTGPTATKYLRG